MSGSGQFINKKNFFLTVLEAGMSKYLPDLCANLIHVLHLFSVIPCGGRHRISFQNLLLKGTNPYLLKAPPCNTLTLGVRI